MPRVRENLPHLEPIQMRGRIFNWRCRYGNQTEYGYTAEHAYRRMFDRVQGNRLADDLLPDPNLRPPPLHETSCNKM